MKPMAASSTPTGATLSDVLKAFHKERSAGGRSLAAKTMDEHRSAVRMFEEHLGEALSVRAITRKHALDYKRALLDTPTRYTLRFPGLTLPQAIKANAKRKEPFETLNPQTINMKWLSHLSSIFEWAANNGYLDSNPAKGVRVDTGSVTHKERTRLTLADIREEQGALVFDLAGASKNEHGKRLVPVHADLIRLGLPAYVERLRKRGETRLFPDWQPGDKVNRWFLRTFLPGKGITDTAKVFHSFRHMLKSELARTGCSRQLSDLITGHADQSVAATYVHDAPLRRMQAALDKVNFKLPIPALSDPAKKQ